MTQAPEVVGGVLTKPLSAVAIATAGNSSFSHQLPGLQLAVDSTSLGEFKICPYRYYLGIIQGYRPRLESVHLTFGLLLHGAIEQYHHDIARGTDHAQAMRNTVRWALVRTWLPALQRGWNSDDPNKNRLTLVRTVVDYLDKYGDQDPVQTLILANGKPAVELSFSFNSGFVSSATGEPFVLCGHLDRIGTLNDVPYIIDVKSTKHTISPGTFAAYTPDNQFSMYTLAGRVAFGVPVKALVVDVAQIAVTFTRFERGLVPRDDGQIDEWLTDTGHWLASMDRCAEQQRWPQNDKSCGLYGGCHFRSVCARSPASRQTWLDAQFTRRVWDPLQRRGDI